MQHLENGTFSSRQSLSVISRATIARTFRLAACTTLAAALAACGFGDNGPTPTADSAGAATNAAAANVATGTTTNAMETAAPTQAATLTSTRPVSATTPGTSTTTNPAAAVQSTASAASTGTSSAAGTTASVVTRSSVVDVIVGDMNQFHDGPSAVLESLPGWGSGASWPEATPRPAGWQYAIPWTHVMADTSSANGNGYPWRVPGPYTGNQAPNTRVQQRDLQMWWLLSDGRWVLGAQSNSMEPVLYPLAWAEGTDTYGTDVWRNESANGGGVSMRSIGRENYSRYLWHTWAAPHVIPSGAVGAVTVFFARKILDNPAGPDDRAQARLMAAGAGDWYRDAATLTAPKVQGSNVLYMGFSRLKYLTNDWQLFAWTSLSEAQLRANPPPINGLP